MPVICKDGQGCLLLHIYCNSYDAKISQMLLVNYWFLMNCKFKLYERQNCNISGYGMFGAICLGRGWLFLMHENETIGSEQTSKLLSLFF